MTVNKNKLDKSNLTKEEKTSIVKMIKTASVDTKVNLKEELAANFLKSLTNYNVRVNVLKLSQEFDIEDLINCMKIAEKVDIDSLIVNEMICC